MILTTRTKINIMRVINRAVMTARFMARLGPETQVMRGGLYWALDLREGIDLSIYLVGRFEPKTGRALMRLVKPGMTVLDIGANMGAHTLPLAQWVGPQGKVFAFEPTDFAFAKLSRNLSLNPQLASRVTLEQGMLLESSIAALPAQLFSSWPLEAANDLHEKHRGRLKTTKGARAIALDDYLNQRNVRSVDVIKLDVDGHELPVLKGARHLLKSSHPVIVMEVTPYIHAEHHQSFEELIDLLRDSGYAFHDLRTQQPLPMQPSRLRDLIGSAAGINVIAKHTAPSAA